MNDIKAVILAGGQGTRLRPVTYEIPKPLIPVRGKAVLSHVVEFMTGEGIGDIAVVPSEQDAPKFLKWKEEGGFSNVTLVPEKKAAGTFGCLRILKEWIGESTFIVANGDCLVEADLGKLVETHRRARSVVTVALVPVCTSGDYAVAEVADGRVTGAAFRYVKAGEARIMGGPNVYDPSFFAYDEPERDFLQIERDIFPKLIRDGKIAAAPMEEGRFFDCGTLESWERAIMEW